MSFGLVPKGKESICQVSLKEPPEMKSHHRKCPASGHLSSEDNGSDSRACEADSQCEVEVTHSLCISLPSAASQSLATYSNKQQS